MTKEKTFYGLEEVLLDVEVVKINKEKVRAKKAVLFSDSIILFDNQRKGTSIYIPRERIDTIKYGKCHVC